MPPVRRQGQRSTPRRGGTPRPPPGAARQDPRLNPDFIEWVATFAPGKGTVPEWYIFRRLEKDGLRHGVDFSYLAYAPGLGRVGQQQVDFVVFGYLAWMVQGTAFHGNGLFADRERDILSIHILQANGKQVVELREQDILTRLEPTYQLALLGLNQSGASSLDAA